MSNNAVRSCGVSDLKMKIFDHEKRKAFETFVVPDGISFSITPAHYKNLIKIIFHPSRTSLQILEQGRNSYVLEEVSPPVRARPVAEE